MSGGSGKDVGTDPTLAHDDVGSDATLASPGAKNVGTAATLASPSAKNLGTDATLASPSARNLGTDATLASPSFNSSGGAGVENTRVGRYLVIRQLGAGAMGRVLEAQDPQLQRTVAIKLALGGSNEELRARLLREAQAAAKVRHPNVVTVHDAGTHSDEVFIAMELVPGGSLRTWLETRRGWREVVRVFLGAARGLAAVHAAGLVHRDFKPDNVLLERDGTARVSDFGLVGRDAALASDPARRTSDWDLTATGALMGTPAYMAPELFQRQPATPAADQFAFCVSLFEALEGKRPFQATSLAELERVVCEGTAAPLTAPVPRWLAALVKRGMATDATQRFASMDQIIEALASGIAPRRTGRWFAIGAALLATATVSAVAMWPREDNACTGGATGLAKVWSPERRSRIAAAVAAVKLASAPALWTQAERQLDEWGNAFVVGHKDACEATRVRKEQSAEVMDARMRCLDERLREVDAFLGIMETADEKAVEAGARAAADLPRVAACANLAWVTARAAPPTDPGPAKAYATAQTALERSKALRRAGRLAEAASTTDAVAPELAQAPPAVRAAFELQRGELLYAAGNYEEARKVLWTAASDFPSSRDAELGFKIWRALSSVEVAVRSLDEARRFADLARGQLESLGKPPELEADLEKLLGLIASNSGKTEEALGHLNRSLALNQRIKGDRRVQLAEDAINISSEYIRLRKPDEAIEHLNKAIALYDELYGKGHLLTATPLNNMSTALRLQGKGAQALEVVKQVVAIREKFLPPNHIDLAKAYNNLGRALEEMDDIEGAIVQYRRSREVRIKAVGEK